MEGYKTYLDMLMKDGVAETGYILSKDGVILATSLPIKELPRYDFKLEDEKNPAILHDIVVDEKVALLEAVANNGVAKQKYGVRLYNQKYYSTRTNDDPEFPVIYFRKDHGGACLIKTKQIIVIGTFNTAIKMSTGLEQNPGELNKRVEAVAAAFRAVGY